MNENSDIYKQLWYTSLFEIWCIRIICERCLEITEKYLIEGIMFFLYIYNFATMIQEKLYKTIKDDCKERKTFWMNWCCPHCDSIACPSFWMIIWRNVYQTWSIEWRLCNGSMTHEYRLSSLTNWELVEEV